MDRFVHNRILYGNISIELARRAELDTVIGRADGTHANFGIANDIAINN
jgi:hypothetical protein